VTNRKKPVVKKRADQKKKGAPAPEPSKAKPKPKPETKAQAPAVEREASAEEEIIDISSIGITPEAGSKKGQLIELDVSFQTGSVISLLISGKDKELLSLFEEGAQLQQIQFYSPIAMFQGTGTVKAKTRISSGPKSGDFSVDISITST
jgi:hypothetical protein